MGVSFRRVGFGESSLELGAKGKRGKGLGVETKIGFKKKEGLSLPERKPQGVEMEKFEGGGGEEEKDGERGLVGEEV